MPCFLCLVFLFDEHLGARGIEPAFYTKPVGMAARRGSGEVCGRCSDWPL